MKKRVDGRTIKGLRIRQQVRERILAAYIDLIRAGVPAPTARETAERAGLSLRVIFKHFPDLRALRLASFNRILVESNRFFSGTAPYRGSAAERLLEFLRLHTRRLEYVTPIRRTAAMVQSTDPDVARAIRDAREGALRDLENALAAALPDFSPGDKRALLMALHTVCSWSSWEFLRTHYRLSPARARAVMSETALAVLAAAIRRRARLPNPLRAASGK